MRCKSYKSKPRQILNLILKTFTPCDTYHPHTILFTTGNLQITLSSFSVQCAEKGSETVFLLSGHDQRIHLYKEASIFLSMAGQYTL